MATTSGYAYEGMFIVTVYKADSSVAFQTDCYGYNNVRVLRKQYLAQGYSRVTSEKNTLGDNHPYCVAWDKVMREHRDAVLAQEQASLSTTQQHVEVLRSTCEQVLSGETPVFNDLVWTAWDRVHQAILRANGDYCVLENMLYELLQQARQDDTVILAVRDVYVSAYSVFQS